MGSLITRTASTNSLLSGKRNRVEERWAQRGFSPADLLNLWKPNGAWEKYDGLAYGGKPRQKLDGLFHPRCSLRGDGWGPGGDFSRSVSILRYTNPSPFPNSLLFPDSV